MMATWALIELITCFLILENSILIGVNSVSTGEMNDIRLGSENTSDIS